ncbi:MAG: PadR family transcriptional regulator [Lachnospiraceae bacterium]|nr:PadR family transcriptional regulator [Lachnospiraceae bacterium]
MDDSQLMKGILEGCVLEIIRRGETYGYQILSVLEECGFENPGEGTLYPLLSRLERGGCILCRKQKSPLGPIRKYYSITPVGEERLEVFRTQYRKVTAAAERALARPEELVKSVDTVQETVTVSCQDALNFGGREFAGADRGKASFETSGRESTNKDGQKMPGICEKESPKADRQKIYGVSEDVIENVEKPEDTVSDRRKSGKPEDTCSERRKSGKPEDTVSDRRKSGKPKLKVKAEDLEDSPYMGMGKESDLSWQAI